MAQIIDFESRKKQIESKRLASGVKNDISSIKFNYVASKNKQAKDKAQKEREQANQKVIKSYRIK